MKRERWKTYGLFMPQLRECSKWNENGALENGPYRAFKSAGWCVNGCALIGAIWHRAIGSHCVRVMTAPRSRFSGISAQNCAGR